MALREFLRTNILVYFMKRISLICPICSKSKIQKVPPGLLDKRNQCAKGIVAILVPENTICEHLFVVYVDMNFSIRDTISGEELKKINQSKLINVNSIEDVVSKISKKNLTTLMKKL